MPLGSISLCTACRHYDWAAADRGQDPRCTAFADGIPEAIWLDCFDHRRPFVGDRGIRFELADDDTLAVEQLELYEKAHAAAAG